jgi:hypothetical protein
VTQEHRVVDDEFEALFQENVAKAVGTKPPPIADLAPDGSVKLPIEAVVEEEHAATLDAEPLATPPAEDKPGEQAKPAVEAKPDATTTAAPATLSMADVVALIPEDKRADVERMLHGITSESGRQAALHRMRQEAEGKASAAETARAAAQAEVERLKGELDAAKKAGAPAAAAAAQAAVDAAEDALAELPELDKAVNLRIERRVSEALKQLGTPPAQAATAPAASPAPPDAQPTDAELEQRAKGYAAITEAHPDWQQLTATPQWNEWMSKQPPGVQALADSPDPRDAIHLISQAKQALKTADVAATAALKSAGQERLKAHVTPRSQAGNSATGAVPQDFDGAFNHFISQKAGERARA